MKPLIGSFLFIFFCSLLTGYSFAQDRDTGKQKDRHPIDTAFTELLLPSNTGEISGADGSMSIALDKKRSLFLWGDSFTGKIENNVRLKPLKFILGNAATVLEGNQSKAYFQGSPTDPTALIPGGMEGDNKYWYWPGDGAVIDGKLLLFMAKYMKTENTSVPFAFKFVGCDLFVLDPYNFSVLQKIPFILKDQPVHYGHGVINKGNTLYIYGSRADNKDFKADLHLMKAEWKNNNLSNKEYWNGTTWVQDSSQTKPLGGISSQVSEQFSIRKFGKRYVLVNQDRYNMSYGKIYSYLASQPQGPFQQERLIHTIDEPEMESDSLFTYNAMFHPQIQRDGQVLISYNVNTFSGTKLWRKGSIYRPRFIWIPKSYFQ